MQDKIQDLRRIGDFDGALRELLQSIERGEREAYLRHVLGRRCLLLDWARSNKGAGFDPRRFDLLCGVGGVSKELILPRIDVLDAICGNHDDEEQILGLLQRAVTVYEVLWQYVKKPFVADVEARLAAQEAEPAFMARLNSESRPRMRRLADQFGWLHPGLLLVGETWAYVWNNAEDLPWDYHVGTWGLLAKADHPSPDGVVAQLTLERVPGRCGALYPHPLSGGYLRTDRSFQDALQNAWWAVIGRERAPPEFDVRWSLSVEDLARKLPLDVTVTRRSMEAALACALKAVLAGEPLDQQTAVTAIFKAPGTDDLSLDKVAAVGDKLLAPQFAATARRARIREVVVADSQHEVTGNGPSAAQETKVANGEVALIPAANLDAAYAHLGRWSKLTQFAREQLGNRAEQILRQQCDPYAEPPLLREEHRADARGSVERKSIEKEEFEQIIRGHLPKRNRLVVLGDSGMGKSMFLVYCEQMIAKDDTLDPFLPLRLGAGPEAASDGIRPEKSKRMAPLSAYGWTRTPDEVLDNLADSVLHTALPEGTDKATRRAWLRHMVERGRVVFLLDALDQTLDPKNSELSALPKFLQSGEIAACPAIITGRPETQQTKASFYAGMDCDVVRTDRFKEPQIRWFLGDLANALMPEYREILPYYKEVWPNLPEDEKWTQYDRMVRAQNRGERRFALAGEDRKLQWADLLEVPILLHELRALARDDDLAGLKNRESVYAKSLDRLIDKGLKAAQDSSHYQRWSLSSVKSLLRKVAWETIDAEASSDRGNGNFTGVIVGEAFEQFREKHGTEFLESLAQIDIITLGSLLDEPGYHALAWRHFSFCEYFAGARLAELPAAERLGIVERRAHDPRWASIFRYAMGWAEREAKSGALADLVHALIRYGNPFVVYNAMAEDKISLQGLPQALDLEQLCRWLVQLDWGYDGNYSTAWEGRELPAVDSATLDVLESLFDRKYRNSRCLYAAWLLLKSSDDPRAKKIQQEFLSEFSAMQSEESRSTERELARKLVNGTVRCPRDTKDDGVFFLMGAPPGEADASDDERPQHPVTVTPFELQSTPVTNAEYELFDPSHRFLRDRFSPDDQCPVIQVNWYMAKMFCLWMGQGWRLPTEAEWEYACRAGTTTRYNTGDEESDLNEAGWYSENSGGRTQPVGTKRANAWGLYDMHGNVWEWCADWYGEKYYVESPREDPPRPAQGLARSVRGGCWLYHAGDCRAAYRSGNWPENRNQSLGFRVARSSSGKQVQNTSSSKEQVQGRAEPVA